MGHKSTSKTEAISWVSDHFLGTGQCITIIDTPGTKDTEGRLVPDVFKNGPNPKVDPNP